MGCGGCSGNKAMKLQKIRQRFKRAPTTRSDGSIKLSERPKMEGIVGYSIDPADPTVLKPDHPPCRHFMSQAMLEQDGSMSIISMCMQSECHIFGQGPLPSDCSACSLREAPVVRRSIKQV